VKEKRREMGDTTGKGRNSGWHNKLVYKKAGGYVCEGCVMGYLERETRRRVSRWNLGE